MAILRLQGEEEKKKNIYFEVDTAQPSIGEGGMGKVMKGICVDVATKVSRPVAIKFLYADLPPHAIERARREASIQLRNDNLVEMLGFIEVSSSNDPMAPKHYHVVSELLHGIPLSDILEGKVADREGNEIPFASKMLKDYQTDPVHFAKTIVSNVLSGLLALHDAGYIHRDIDPSNIMLTEDGHIKLIDFGIAKQVSKLTTNDRSLTTTGSFMGKAEYAAPELALGDLKHQDQTTDIYAMGILLYQCIIGHVPFEGPTNVVLEKQINKKIPLTVIKDKGMRAIIACATEKNQAMRYQSAAQMRVALENLDGKKRKMSAATRNKIIIAAAAIVLAIIGAVGYSVYSNNQEKQKAIAMEQQKNETLKATIKKNLEAGDKFMKEGDAHDEGFERAYISAFEAYHSALSTSEKITDGTAQDASIMPKIQQAAKVLADVTADLQQRKQEFDADGLAEVAAEFQQRIDNIQKTLKKYDKK